MPTNDEPAPKPRASRRSLGRGPGTALSATEPAATEPSTTEPSTAEPAVTASAVVPAPAPAPDAEAVPAPDAGVAPAPGPEAGPAPGAEAGPASAPGAEAVPAPGAEAVPAPVPSATEPALPGASGGGAPDVVPGDAADMPPDAADGPGGAAGAPDPADAAGALDGAGRAPDAPDGADGADGAPDPAGAPADAAGADPGAAAGGASEGRARGSEGEARGEEATGRFTVRLANFEGPFDLLLQLISKHKLDVTEVALSKVTDEFMAHIRAMGPDWDLDQTTEFLVVAATLLDLKAARLLPAAEVEDEADLALLEARDLLFARLLQYRAYKEIAEIFQERLTAEARRYPRTVGLEPHHAELLPEVVISIGAEGFAQLAVKAMQPRAKPQVYVDHIHAPLVSVREQGQVMIARLREFGEASFHALTEDAPDTLTVVARFLALLELYRERAVVLDQEEALGSLMVRWTGGDGEQPIVTDEFDQPPVDPSGGGDSRQKEQS
ncbi:segregation/condensation protein A [Streptomyces sp. NPDC002055]|uniref:segregation and condensation protein A n=1 Tax=Streptomyces sp. NPDC002055 TaxID=3154534 RepID=UPI00331D7E18